MGFLRPGGRIDNPGMEGGIHGSHSENCKSSSQKLLFLTPLFTFNVHLIPDKFWCFAMHMYFLKNEDQFSLREKKIKPLQLWSEMYYAVFYFKHNGVMNETSFVPLKVKFPHLNWWTLWTKIKQKIIMSAHKLIIVFEKENKEYIFLIHNQISLTKSMSNDLTSGTNSHVMFDRLIHRWVKKRISKQKHTHVHSGNEKKEQF